ncbi:MAG: ribokinase [Planctomycetes bacterium]|nr:ribokinase [Planctomycetota bacterium]
MPRPCVVVVGSSNTDMIIRCRSLPSPGQTVLGGALERAAGGKGANQAVAARRAGADVHLIARVGGDEFGRQARRDLRRSGVHVGRVRVTHGVPSGVALIVVDGAGENLIAVAPGANSRLTPKDIEACASLFCSARVALFQLETPLPTVARGITLARRSGCLVILNPAPARPLPASLLRQIDVLTPNELEAAALTGFHIHTLQGVRRAAERLLAMGVRSALVTLGSRGVALVQPGRFARIPAFAVRPVDTVGAGDAFNGALACSLAEGRPVEEAARFACAAAALATTRRGAQPSMPRRREIARLLARKSGTRTLKS